MRGQPTHLMQRLVKREMSQNKGEDLTWKSVTDGSSRIVFGGATTKTERGSRS